LRATSGCEGRKFYFCNYDQSMLRRFKARECNFEEQPQDARQENFILVIMRQSMLRATSGFVKGGKCSKEQIFKTKA
jgi:hypothetical protein